MKENLCSEAGCSGNCCRDSRLEVTRFERKRLFPNAVGKKTVSDLMSEKAEGVYFTGIRRKKFGKISGIEEVRIIGNCPNLDEIGNCTKYAERSYAARNFIFGCDECNKFRRRDGLPLVEKV